jgi:hypothetical protein
MNTMRRPSGEYEGDTSYPVGVLVRLTCPTPVALIVQTSN